jgi:Adenylosuccinate synthase
MKIDVITGGLYGDEGKGKIVSNFGKKRNYDYIFRVNASTNASHTVVTNNGDKYITKQLPSVFDDERKNFVIAPNAVLNLHELKNEVLSRCDKETLKGRVFIASTISLIIKPYFEINNKSKASTEYGSTNQCTGIAIIARTGRHCLRLYDIYNVINNISSKETIIDKIKFTCEQLNSNFNQDKNDKYYESILDEMIADFKIIEEYLGEYCIDYSNLIYNLDKNSNILVEGCNGIMLDNIHGLNPYTTSSGTTLNSLLAGANLPIKYLNDNYVVISAYFCCLNKRPFLTEMNEEELNKIYSINSEVDNAENMKRRLGYFDLPTLKKSLIGHDGSILILNKLDVMRNLEDIKVCTHYQSGNKLYELMPDDVNELATLTPVYKTFEPFGDISSIDNYEDMPKSVKKFIEFIEKETGFMIKYIGKGPRVDDLIVR